MDYPIEQGVPIPKPRGHIAKYPWKDMKVGDSFFIPEGEVKHPHAFHYNAKRTGIKVAVRRVEGGVRVWRVG